MQKAVYLLSTSAVIFLCGAVSALGQGNAVSQGKRLFESETFGGNGRTCRTCHSKKTGTVSPEDAQNLYKTHPNDPLFFADGSDDGIGNGTTRIRANATILVRVPLSPKVKLGGNLNATHVTVRRGIPTTLNTPALDPVLMLDGRQPNLQSQALGAIQDHAQATALPSAADLEGIKQFQLTNEFFSSPEVRKFAEGGPALDLPEGKSASEKRGRRFFEDVVDFVDPKHGLCAGCHAGPMLNQTNLFAQITLGIPVGTRFQTIGISELNVAGNPVQEFIFNQGLANERHVFSPDIGRSAITGVTDLEDIPPSSSAPFSNFNAFKIPQLRGISDTGPYFHDNSAKTLEDVMTHYTNFFAIVTGNTLILTPQDRADVVAFMKLLR
jgi:cytochrome c peroxidase